MPRRGRRIGEPVRRDGFQERFRVGHARFRLAPILTILPRQRDAERLLRDLHAGDRVMQRGPVFRAHSDVDVDAQRCAGRADGVCAVLEDVMHLADLAAGHLFGVRGPVRQVNDGVDGVGVEDMVGSEA
jgi:hypothetical protein